MTFTEKAQRTAVSAALRPLLGYAAKDTDKHLPKMANRVTKMFGRVFPAKAMTAFRNGANDPENTWNRFAATVLRETDPEFLRKLLLSLGLGIYNGTKLVRANREKYKCNIPFQILFDPTSACNLRCKGCWAAEYDKHERLSFEEMDSIVTQASDLGTRVFMITGGEPLICKKELMQIAEKHNNCTFLIYTNATLIDEALVLKTKELGNVVFAISLEGFENENDARRGAGAFKRSMEAIALLQKHRILFGLSICYTSANLETVTSDAFLDYVIEQGARFIFYFHYMPVGANAVTDLLPSAHQRERMYRWLRKVRAGKGGKPIFVMDFQNDGEYVGGCIAGGRNYFHINSAGDMEPCVFVHYSDSNIREHTIIEALKRPLFQAYYKGQPFNDNHLRPCPLLENPNALREVIGATGAVSTDPCAPESVESLCSKCDRYAEHWKPVAQRIWETSPHPTPKTQYYRDERKEA
ncbi:MAG: radical SAM protein [Oscillospiraceae bacterium]|jgi:MoaA/NifB/PqqE/SkfB family radical SAM enzyme|nr:radical SAM protein [Oscillospiraceae bacterium]